MDQAASKLTSGEFGIVGIILAVVLLAFAFLLRELIKDKKADRDMMIDFLTRFQSTQNAIMVEVGEIAGSMKSLVTEMQHERRSASRGN